MITEIGIVAGEIWQFLEKKERVMLEELFKKIDKSKELILMSLGWLAREGHVILEKKEDTYDVRLRKKKKGIVLVVVMGALVVMCLLALIAIKLATQRVELSDQRVKALKAQFALQAGVVDAVEKLRKGNLPTLGNPLEYSLDSEINGFSVGITVKVKGEDSSCPSTAPSDYCIFVTVIR